MSSIYANIFNGIRDFSLHSIQNFPFTMAVSFLVLGFVFVQPSWVLLTVGIVLVYLIVIILQTGFGYIAPIIPFINQLNTPLAAGPTICYPFSGTVRQFTFPSEWMTETAFILFFFIYNSYRISKLNGNKKLFDAYSRRMSKTQISMLVSGILLFIACLMRSQMGCDNGYSVMISTAIGIGLAVLYWNILDICNTKLNSDVLGITRNMAPPTNDDEQAIVCHAS
jgi:hypothetical protein